LKPLQGLTLLHTRPAVDGDPYAQALADAGAVIVPAPMIAFAPARDPSALEHAIRHATALLLTSPRAVSSVAAFVQPGTTIYPLHGATLAAVRKTGLAAVELPDATDGASLGHALARHHPVSGESFTLPTSDLAHPAVVNVLKSHGAHVHVVEAYQTVAATQLPPGVLESLRQGHVHAVLCMSPSAVDTLVALAGVDLLKPLLRIAPGDTTALAWSRHGLPCSAVAQRPSPDAVVQALRAHWPRP
jgi:uroporphyrinogen-III synthase